MADIDLKTETPDTTLPTDGFLFGADSQSAASPSVYPVQSLATTLLGSTTLSGATVTTDAPVLNLSQTWNDAAVTFTGLKLTVTDTASAAASNLIDLQVGGVSKFKVDKSTDLIFSGSSVTSVISSIVNPNYRIVINRGSPAINFGVNQASAGTAIMRPAGFAVGASSYLAWSGLVDRADTTIDLFLTRKAAANLRFGAADAAAPVAQTLSVQSVVAGTTDTAGVDFTIDGSQGTGTGAGGSIVFQVAPAGASGTAQNALTSALALRSLTKATELFGPLIWNGVQAPAAPPNDPANAIHCTNAMYFTQNYAIRFATYNGGELNLGSGGALTWNSGSIPGISANDIFLRRDAADTLAQRRDTNAQESRIYGSYTSATNFQRLSIKTLRESSGALSGASYTTTIAIPAYAHLIGVTTRVTTEVTGATTYDVGDGSDVDLWGAAIGVTLGSQSRTADFTNIAAVGPAATARTVTLTANGSNFTAGVIEICLHYLTTEAD
jgi:hypothetical protein